MGLVNMLTGLAFSEGYEGEDREILDEEIERIMEKFNKEKYEHLPEIEKMVRTLTDIEYEKGQKDTLFRSIREDLKKLLGGVK